MIQIKSTEAPFTSPRLALQAVTALGRADLVAGDLAGAYNEIGIRQWFKRKRAQLDGRAPLDWLKAPWKPTELGPLRVRNLAQALTASPAT